MTVIKKLVTLLRGSARELGESVVDANATRIYEQEIVDARHSIDQARGDLTGVMAADSSFFPEDPTNGLRLTGSLAAVSPKGIMDGMPSGRRPQPLGNGMWELVQGDLRVLLREQAKSLEFALSPADLERALDRAAGEDPPPGRDPRLPHRLLHHGVLRAGRVAKAAAVAHAQARGVAGVDQQLAGHAQVTRKGRALVEQAADQQRPAGVLHGVDVEQVVGAVDKGPQGAGSAQLQRVSCAEQLLVAPDAVQVFVHAACGMRVGRAEAGKGRRPFGDRARPC